MPEPTVESTDLSEIPTPEHLLPVSSLPPITATQEFLPYHLLGAQGLERLCYLLLLHEGKVPHYFGRLGQAQYGIDLLISEDGRYTVFQCKNVSSFTSTEINSTLECFQREWLGRGHLPAPDRFILCCPLDLRGLKETTVWLAWQQRLHDENQAHQVDLVLWDLSYLNERLRRLPDLVADLFSDRAAEIFCNVPDWNDGLFRPVRPGSGDRVVERYLELAASGSIYLSPQLNDTFTTILDRSDSILIIGLPGSGKTTSALALASALEGGFYRTFYVDLLYEWSEGALYTGIKRRLTRPTVFIFDNCQSDFRRAQRLRDRLTPLMAGNCSFSLVFLAHLTLTPTEIARIDPEFIENLRQETAVLELDVSVDNFREIITRRKPEFEGLSKSRLQKLFDLTGRDLACLDLAIEAIEEPADIDELNLEIIFRSILRHRFEGKNFLPAFFNIAVLSQFNVAPLADAFPLDPLLKESAEATAALIVTAGLPPRNFFVHSSAAELIARAIAWRHGMTDYWAEAAERLSDYLAQIESTGNTAIADFNFIIRGRLRLREANVEARLKGYFLADDRVYAFFARMFDRLPLNTVIACLLLESSSSSPGRYWRFVRDKIHQGVVVRMLSSQPFWETSLFLKLLERSPDDLSLLRAQVRSQGLDQIIDEIDLQRFLAILSSFAEPLDASWQRSVEQLTDSQLDRLVEKTIRSRNSLGKIFPALRRLKRINPLLLQKIEERLGSNRLIAILGGTGTLIGVIELLSYISPETGESLVALLEEETLNSLLERDRLTNRSVDGTLSMTLRRLGFINPPLLRAIERKIGARRQLALLARAGTIMKLMNFLQYSSHEFASDLISLLDDEILDTLIKRTLERGRPIATFHLSLRDFGRDEDLLREFESRMGARRYMTLVRKAGTFVEFVKMLRYSSPAMAKELVALLDDNDVRSLLQRTLAAEKSLGTIHLPLAEIKEANPVLFSVLERRIGAAQYLRLFMKAGTLIDFAKNLTVFSPSFAMEQVALIDSEGIDSLIERTLNTQRSIAWIGFAVFGHLKKINVDLLRLFEEKVGVHRYLYLVARAGTIFELFSFIAYSTPEMGDQLIAALDDGTLDVIIENTVAKKRSIGALGFSLRSLERERPLSLRMLEIKMGPHRYLRLLLTRGTIFELFNFLQFSSSQLVRDIVDLVTEGELDILVEKTISARRSVGTLAFSLRKLQKERFDVHELFERKVGVHRLWLLTVALGDFQSATSLLQHMTPAGRREFRQAILSASVEELCELIARSTFVGLARFTRSHAVHPPVAFGSERLEGIASTIEALIEKESWWRLYQGYELLKSSPRSPLKTQLASTLKQRLEGMRVDTLYPQGFRETASCAALLWQEAESRNRELARALLRLLPEPQSWLVEDDFIRIARLPLSILSSTDAPGDIALATLESCNRHEVAALISEAEPNDVFLFVWSVYSAWYVWLNEDRSFAQWLNKDVAAAVQDVARKIRFLKLDSDKHDASLALIGLLSFVGLPLILSQPKKKVMDLSLLGKIQARALDKRFVPGVFLLMGLEMAFDPAFVVPRLTWQKILLLAGEEAIGSPALDGLRSLVIARPRKR